MLLICTANKKLQYLHLSNALICTMKNYKTAIRQISPNRSRFKEKLVTSIPDLTVSGMGVTL